MPACTAASSVALDVRSLALMPVKVMSPVITAGAGGGAGEPAALPEQVDLTPEQEQEPKPWRIGPSMLWAVSADNPADARDAEGV